MDLSDIYTELYIVEGHTGGVCQEHEVWQIEAMSRVISADCPVEFSKIFLKDSRKQKVVLTLGIAGVGKTVSVQKFALEWAEGRTNQDLDLVFLLPFRDLNPIMEERFSLLQLISYFYHKLDLSSEDVEMLDGCNIMFVFDGLDECCHTLKFTCSKMVYSVTEEAPVSLLLVNLITGNIFPSAHVWITTRPAAAHQIPRKLIHLTTEVRGFSDHQKDEYFMKVIRDKKQAQWIISHIKKSKSLYIMCHIPVFCWMSATVLQQMLGKDQEEEQQAPATLTEMYINFMLYQTDLKLQKYPGKYEGILRRQDYSKEILKLAELAFRNLMQEKFIFFEMDLQDCGLDVQAATVYSGIFTEIFRKEKTLYRTKAFSFVHLSIQEFLAAVYVFYVYSTVRRSELHENVLNKMKWQVKRSLHDLHKLAIKKSLQSESGHLDLFLRFLLGISLPSNHSLLTTIFPRLKVTKEVESTVEFIKLKIREKISAERSINLLHCLNEINDQSLLEEIKSLVTSRADHALSPADCSALVYLLLMSAKELDEFDLQRYLRSDEGLRRTMPLVVASKGVQLNRCNLTKQSCKILAGAFNSRMSCITDLDLSHNDLQDAGVLLLTQGLGSPHCKLQTLKLCGCRLTDRACSYLASALSGSSRLRGLDLRENPVGEKGIGEMLSLLKSCDYKLDKLQADGVGEVRKRLSLLRYKTPLTLDPTTAHGLLRLSDGDTGISWCTAESYPPHPDRLRTWKQIMCQQFLFGQHYWEAQWSGSDLGFTLGITYKGISRIGEAKECLAGYNEKSWSLRCSDFLYTAMHHGPALTINRVPKEPDTSDRMAVYLDWPAGTLSFFRVSSDIKTLSHIYTFNTKFAEPVSPVFILMHQAITVKLNPEDKDTEPPNASQKDMQ